MNFNYSVASFSKQNSLQNKFYFETKKAYGGAFLVALDKPRRMWTMATFHKVPWKQNHLYFSFPAVSCFRVS